MWEHQMSRQNLPQTQTEASIKAFSLRHAGTVPETIHWATRMLPMKIAFEISGRSSSSYYRDVQIGRMPAPVPIGGSSRIPGWELLTAINKLIDEADRDGEAA
jgi:predicted DNA-binding transcriptional regulator AlpA